MKSSRALARPHAVRTATAVLGTAAFLALGCGAAQADDAIPSWGPIVMTIPPVDTAPADPAPSDPAPSEPGTDPAPVPDPSIPGEAPPPPAPAPAPGSDTPVYQVPQPAPVLTPAPQSPVAPALPPANVPAGTEVSPGPFVEQELPPVDQAEEASPSPSETAAQVPATTQPTMTTAPKPSIADVAASSPVVQAAVTAATGSPLGVQIATVLALLGAGFAYFRLLGSKGRVAPKGGR